MSEFSSLMTDEALLGAIGARLARVRLARNLTQEQVAERAGLGLRTVQRLELGEGSARLAGFLRVCRVLGLIERLDLLIPDDSPGPVAQWKRHGKRRRRASGRPPEPPAPPDNWTWGDRP